jgi:tetratricopeptide (TPR) repeat protein
VRPRLFICAISVTASLLCAPVWTHADTPASTASAADRQAAAQAFAEGQRAFTLGDFPHAAESFEKAYSKAPHHSALWNAARSWQKAGETARAANLYARYLREAPPNAPDRNSASSALQKISTKLARLEIHATGIDDLKVDGEPIESTSVYVTPGTHLIEGHAGDRVVRQSQPAEAGAVVSVALVAPPPVASSAAKPIPTPPTSSDKPSSGKLPPTVVYVGGAVTVVLAGVMVWSGLNTLSQKDAFDSAPTQANLDDGHSRQTRTNILLGVTAGVAVLTTVAAVWLVDWKGKSDDKGPASVKVGVAGESLVVRGSF